MHNSGLSNLTGKRGTDNFMRSHEEKGRKAAGSDPQMDAIANLFKEGHRIRLGIASSSFPSFLPNPGTPSTYLTTRALTSENVIYHDSRYPSAIEIPVRGK